MMTLMWVSGRMVWESPKPLAAPPAARDPEPALTMAAADETPSSPPPEKWVLGKMGPWGKIETLLFSIDLPDEFVYVPGPEEPPVRWSFPGSTKEKVLATLRSVGVPEQDVKSLDSHAAWGSVGGVVTVEPGDGLILSLAPKSVRNCMPFWSAFRKTDSRSTPSGFGPAKLIGGWPAAGWQTDSIGLLKHLLYAQGENKLLFADFEPALRRLPSDAERRRFMKTISRKRAVLACLTLDRGTDIDKIVQYWGVGGQRKDLLPLLTAVHRVETGCKLNLVYLLPDFVREHLYRHPFISADAKAVKQDCFWSAFNFFNNPPDDHFNDMGYVRQVLERDYYQVQEPSQLGDLILVTAENNTVIHAAAYVADDLVFTKNGDDFRQPWMLMHMNDMLDTYAVKYPVTGALKPQYFRKKGL